MSVLTAINYIKQYKNEELEELKKRNEEAIEISMKQNDKFMDDIEKLEDEVAELKLAVKNNTNRLANRLGVTGWNCDCDGDPISYVAEVEERTTEFLDMIDYHMGINRFI